jgi:hypothetical protein
MSDIVGDRRHIDVIVSIQQDDELAGTLAIKWMENWRSRLPMEFAKLLIGPITLNNGWTRYFFSACGSNKGWSTQLDHEKKALELKERFDTHEGGYALLVVDDEWDSPEVR